MGALTTNGLDTHGYRDNKLVAMVWYSRRSANIWLCHNKISDNYHAARYVGGKLGLNVNVLNVSELPRHCRRRHNNRKFRNIRILSRTYKVHTLREEYGPQPLKNVNILLKGLKTTDIKWVCMVIRGWLK